MQPNDGQILFQLFTSIIICGELIIFNGASDIRLNVYIRNIQNIKISHYCTLILYAYNVLYDFISW